MARTATETPSIPEAAGRGQEGQEGREEQADDIARLLFVIAHQTVLKFEAAAAEFEIAPPLARALLGLEEPAPMGVLAASLACDASNITSIADRLEDRGLIERQPDAHDRRVKLLVLTQAGEKLRATLAARIAETAPVMTELSATERETLHALLAKIAGPEADSGIPPGW